MRVIRKKKVLFTIIFLGICSLFSPILTQAQELPPGIVIGDSEGLHATRNGEYHVKVNDVLPGKKWHTTISMVNMEKDVPYQLTMLISPAVVSGSLDLSKAIQMTLTYEGKVVYQGPASGISDTVNLQTTALNLGIFRAGDSRALEVDYSLSGEYTKQDFVQKNVMDNVWTYYAVKPTESTPPSTSGPSIPPSAELGGTKPVGRFPSTGESVKQGMIFLCLGLFLVLVVLLIWKKKHEETTNPNRKE